jgi:hypothetical protein
MDEEEWRAGALLEQRDRGAVTGGDLARRNAGHRQRDATVPTGSDDNIG